MQSRTNRQVSQAVENGLHIDNDRGAARAWAFMATASVPVPVIIRVLGEPRCRRPTDPPYIAGVSHLQINPRSKFQVRGHSR